ncbi:hypothetical protein VKT23_009701 [Stygiomarasmius scandens]|uniref:Uncharacterized protein n=1 Tax=Marasmiellus scandens TaxID=2682957 RepID=A0ABR1JGG5_9AGAR
MEKQFTADYPTRELHHATPALEISVRYYSDEIFPVLKLRPELAISFRIIRDMLKQRALLKSAEESVLATAAFGFQEEPQLWGEEVVVVEDEEGDSEEEVEDEEEEEDNRTG